METSFLVPLLKLLEAQMQLCAGKLNFQFLQREPNPDCCKILQH